MNDTIIVKYENDGEAVSLTIGRANVLMAARKSVLLFEADKMIKAAKEAETPLPPEISLLRSFTYPDDISALLKSEGKLTVCGADGNPKIIDFSKPITFEDFCLLPSEILLEWEKAVYELNPHWYPTLPEKDVKETTAQKKTGNTKHG